jgi:predicted RNA-binding Zn-ribbon protein involved in translation (DUF1610 family)
VRARIKNELSQGDLQGQKKEAKFVCDKCGANVKKKDQVCKAVKIKKTDKKSAKEK